MLEEDYLAFKNREQKTENRNQKKKKLTEEETKEINNFSSKIMKEVILPQIEKEVNDGKNFAQLRQIYHSLILATWFKQKLKTQIAQIKTTDDTDNILQKAYLDKKKIKGVESADPQVKEKVYSLYLEAYKNGLYNYIKKDFDPYEKKQIKRRYYSGGVDWAGIAQFISASLPNQRPHLKASSSSLSIRLTPSTRVLGDSLIPSAHKEKTTVSSALEQQPPEPGASSAVEKDSDPGLCLTPDSLITLADGTTKPLIELKPHYADRSQVTSHRSQVTGYKSVEEGGAGKGKVKADGDGDWVLSLNEQTQKLEPHRVLALLDMGVKPVYRITTASGKTLKTTLTHPYLTPGGWKKLTDIKVGEEVAVVYKESKNVLQNSLNLFHGKRGQISQLLTDEDIVYGNDFTYLNDRGFGEISLADFISTEKIFVLGDYLGDVRGNGYSDDIAVGCVKFAGRNDYRRPLFKSGKICKRKRNKNDIPLFKDYHRCYLQDYSRSQKNSPLPLREEYHQGISLAGGVNPEGVVFAPQAVIEKFPLQLFPEHSSALSFSPFLKYIIFSSLLSRLFITQECQAAEITAGGGISWDKIISIEPLGPMQVYDIEVGATHNFIAQGIVAHNTYTNANGKSLIANRKEETAGSALENKGGIDLNPQNLKIKVIGEGGASSSALKPLPFDLQNFQGFSF